MKGKAVQFAILLFLFLITPVWAVRPIGQNPNRPMPTPPGGVQPLIKIKADLKVDAIYATPCPFKCEQELNRIDAMYVDYIAVKVGYDVPQQRIDIPYRIVPVRTQVNVSFYDLKRGQNKTITKWVTISPRSSQEVQIFVNSPHLIKKSTGITATIVIPSNVVLDNSANNSITLKHCQNPPIY